MALRVVLKEPGKIAKVRVVEKNVVYSMSYCVDSGGLDGIVR